MVEVLWRRWWMMARDIGAIAGTGHIGRVCKKRGGEGRAEDWASLAVVAMVGIGGAG